MILVNLFHAYNYTRNIKDLYDQQSRAHITVTCTYHSHVQTYVVVGSMSKFALFSLSRSASVIDLRLLLRTNVFLTFL